MPYLAPVAEQLTGSNVALGAQNVSEHEAGAFTGETAASMLKDLGCEYVIVGHSERRADHGGELRPEHLDGDLPFQLGVAGPIDFAL